MILSMNCVREGVEDLRRMHLRMMMTTTCDLYYFSRVIYPCIMMTVHFFQRRERERERESQRKFMG